MDLTNPTQIKDLLERHSFHFSKTFGQNFLITARIPEKIAEGAEIDESTTVLEIGPGIGCLTRCLAARAKKVVTVEIDDRLLPILQETLGDLSNVQVVHGDILKTDLNALLGNEEKLAVCANLPYNITTPILVYLLESGLSFESITVMVQKEVAQRFCAERGSKDYGAITLFLNYYTKPKMLFSVGAGNFLPKPRVDTPPEELFRLIRAAFSMRRKTLQNTLASAGISKERTAAALEALNLPATTRGEELGLAEYAALARELDKTEP